MWHIRTAYTYYNMAMCSVYVCIILYFDDGVKNEFCTQNPMWKKNRKRVRRLWHTCCEHAQMHTHAHIVARKQVAR
jgi:hypothetical protein